MSSLNICKSNFHVNVEYGSCITQINHHAFPTSKVSSYSFSSQSDISSSFFYHFWASSIISYDWFLDLMLVSFVEAPSRFLRPIESLLFLISWEIKNPFAGFVSSSWVLSLASITKGSSSSSVLGYTSTGSVFTLFFIRMAVLFISDCWTKCHFLSE